jgi:hypothetical protein
MIFQNKKKLSLPPTPKMIETLMEMHERELLKLENLTIYHTKHISGLYIRGMIDTVKVSDKLNKMHVGFCITRSGKEFLEEYIRN